MAPRPEFPKLMSKSISHLVMALMLAAMLPLELAQCAWMGVGAAASTCSAGAPGACGMTAASHASGASHACCVAKGMTAPRPARQRSDTAKICGCTLLPAGMLPAAVGVDASPASHAFVAVATDRDLSAPVSLEREIPPAPDVGSAPLPAALGAHLLRAPPISV